MRTLEQIGREFFEAFDDTLVNAFLGIHTQLSVGDAEELSKLCDAIQDSEEDIYNMSSKLKELSDKLMECDIVENVVAYLDLSFRTESLIDKLIKFTSFAQSENLSTKIKADALEELDKEYKRYIESKNKYNM